MKKVLLIILGFALCSCSNPQKDPLRKLIGSYKNYYNIKGKIKKERYYSPNNVFSIGMPNLIKPGVVVTDTFKKDFGTGVDDKEVGTVTFVDDFGKFLRVDTFRIPNEIAKNNANDNLLLSGIRRYMMDVYESDVPGSKMVHQEYINRDGKIFDYFAVMMKNGSILTINGSRRDELRGTLVFIDGNYIYLISTQNSHVLENQKSDQKEAISKLKTNLFEAFETFESKK